MSTQKTVVVASNTAWFLYNFHLALIQTLQQEGYRVVAIAPKDDYALKLSEEGVAFMPITINSKGTNPLEDLLLIRDFYHIYKASNADIILNFTIKPNIYGSIAARFLGIPVIGTITGLGTLFLQESLSTKIGKMLYKIALKVPRKVYYLNQTDRDLFIHAALIDAKKAKIIPGAGIDTEKFKPLPKSTAERKTVRFLMIARLIKDKGIMEFVNAAKIFRENYRNHHAEFYILGAYYEGNPTAVKKEEIDQWEKEGLITYLGTSDDVPSVIADADCVVLPSYREGISQVLLEAASMAKPIIATDVPGCKEVVDHEKSGYLCKVKDADSLARTMERMAALSYEEREAMGKNGREKVIREFDEKVVNALYLKSIEAILTS